MTTTRLTLGIGAFAILICSSSAFVPRSALVAGKVSTCRQNVNVFTPLFESSMNDDNEEPEEPVVAAPEAVSPGSSRSRKRLRRKDKSAIPEMVEEDNLESVVERGRSVSLEIEDIRSITGVKTSTTTPTTSSEEGSNPLAGLPNPLTALSNMFAPSDEFGEVYTKEEETPLWSSVLSNLVVADFFFVLVLLVWFVLGIFCSNVLKDDTVQLAFNGIFQSVVQPALGFLMIAAVLSGVLGDDNKEEPRF